MSRRFTPAEDYLLFLELLVQARRDRGVSTAELAHKLDLAPDQVAAFENGERQIDFVQTREWCLALGVPFLEFMVQLDREISAPFLQGETAATQTPDADADAEQTDADDPYGVGHHVLPHVPPVPDADAPEPDPTVGGAK